MSAQRIAMWTVVLIAFIVAVGYRASVLHEPAPPPVPRLVFITGGTGPFWQLTTSGAKSAARKYDAELLVMAPADEENVDQQVEILKGLDTSTLDGIAISPLDAKGQTELINQLAAEKIVVTFDSAAPDSNRHSHVGTGNFVAGYACARMVKEALPNGGKVAVLVVNLTKENVIDRKNAFQERIEQVSGDVAEGAAPNFTVVGYLEDNGSAGKCTQNIKDIINKNRDLACIVGMNAKHGPILLRALKDLGKLDQITLITFDTPEETLDGIEQGHIYATIAQDPFRIGYTALSQLCTLVQGDPLAVPIVGKGSEYLGIEVVRQDNLDQFRAALRKQLEAAEGQEKAAATKKAA